MKNIYSADIIVTASGQVLKNRFGNAVMMIVDEEGNVISTT